MRAGEDVPNMAVYKVQYLRGARQRGGSYLPGCFYTDTSRAHRELHPQHSQSRTGSQLTCLFTAEANVTSIDLPPVKLFTHAQYFSWR